MIGSCSIPDSAPDRQRWRTGVDSYPQSAREPDSASASNESLRFAMDIAPPDTPRANIPFISSPSLSRIAPTTDCSLVSKRSSMVKNRVRVGEPDIAPHSLGRWRRGARSSGIQRRSAGFRPQGPFPSEHPRRRQANTWGKWLVAASILSWRAASISTTSAPVVCHMARIRTKAAELDHVGVRFTKALLLLSRQPAQATY
uniref:Uncharacterized protein n=1 Tax=Candidatus Kentrum sp. TC TaxID=2126339 RepID=A0A450YAS2_9GAMM|nr:MAG: hypothetical protein BECKTC1821D_GA0114238_100519 [Candidatus Kentron sp. TC]